MFGMIVNALIKNSSYYIKLSNLNFIKSKKHNKAIGLERFTWFVKHTLFKYFNQKLKFDKNVEISELSGIRKEMTIAEISHLIGFLFVTVFAVQKGVTHNYVFGITIMGINILMNLYPSLLQQQNKRRIDLLLRRNKKRS
jgi:hypothetical protein